MKYKNKGKLILNLKEFEAILDHINYATIPETTAEVLDYMLRTIKDGGEVVIRNPN